MLSANTTEVPRARPVSPFRIEMASEADDAVLRQLLRETPMDGRIRLTLEREPSFFAAARIEGDPRHAAVARDAITGQIIAMGGRSVREAFVNGQPVRLGYLSQLRIHLGFRSRTRQLLRGGFDLLRSTRTPDEASFDITTIIADNTIARRLLTARLTGLPVYRELEPIVTLLLPVRRCPLPSGIRIERGTPELRASILRCLDCVGRRHQFAPRWTAQNLAPDGPRLEDFFLAVAPDGVVGCVAFWDQRAFKQTVVRGYAGALARWRPLLNLFGARLPAVGETLPLAYVSHLAVEHDDPVVFANLLRAVLHHARRRSDCQWLALGLAARHPLLPVARRFGARAYVSVLYAVHDPGREVSLDDRIPHVEVAWL